MTRLFPFPGMFGKLFTCNTFLPRPGCKQFQLGVKAWHARLNASTILWGTNPAIGLPGTELDLTGDLDLDTHSWFFEFESRCQIRKNWGVRFAFMPWTYEENHRTDPADGFYFGYLFYPGASALKTKWDRFVYKWDLVYDWFNGKHAVSSVFGGYALYDDKLTISSSTINNRRTRSRNFGLAYAGMSIDRVIRRLGGGAASVHCKWSVQFLEDYFGWDGYAAGRLAVPMNCGRWGYLEAGWRWIRLERRKPTDIDSTSLDGLTIAAGLTF